MKANHAYLKPVPHALDEVRKVLPQRTLRTARGLNVVVSVAYGMINTAGRVSHLVRDRARDTLSDADGLVLTEVAHRTCDGGGVDERQCAALAPAGVHPAPCRQEGGQLFLFAPRASMTSELPMPRYFFRRTPS